MATLIPMLLFPLLFFIIGMSLDKTVEKAEENMTVAIIDGGDSSLARFLKEQEILKPVESTAIEDDLKNGDILLAVEIPAGHDESIAAERPVTLVLTYDNASQASQLAMNTVRNLIDSYSAAIVRQRLETRNIGEELLTPVLIETRVTDKEAGMGKFMLSLLLPLMLVTFCVSGPMGAAADLGAGEKERGTLEPLLTTQAGRLSLLWGKFFAVTIMGLLGTAASLVGLYITTRLDIGLFQGASVSLEVKNILLVGIVTMLMTMVFSALELAISIFARSFKEAQTYLSPLMMISFVPTYATYMLDAKNIDLFYFHIPLANITCIIKEFLAGIYNYTHMGITFAWIIVYIVGAILFARYMFGKEEVVFRA